MNRTLRLALFAVLLAPPSPGAAQSQISDLSGGASVEPEPCPFWGAEESARYRVECGKLVVPETEGGGGRYRLQVAILRSLGERLHDDAIVVIPGGPGGSIVRDVPRLAQQPLLDAMRQHRDALFVDPRGTGFSEPGELCPALERTEVRAAFLRLPFQERTAFVRRQLESCRARLQKAGIAPEQFNSVAVARDLDSLRRALGYEQLNLIGISWGTRVALETMRRFPESVRSAILYGPLPPDSWAPGSSADRVGPSLERLFAACRDNELCRAEYPALEQDFAAMLAELDADPIRLNTRWGPLEVDGSFAETVVSYALYDTGFLPYIPLAIRELRHRNAAFTEALVAGVLGQAISGGFYYAAHCFELPAPLSADSLQRLRDRYPSLGRPDRFAPDPAAVCDAFTPPSADSIVFEPVRSDVPTLIFVGEFDPTTPPKYGRRAAATLPNAHLVVLRGKGHDLGVPIPSCTVQIRTMFLENPLQAPDASCIAGLPPLSFATNVHANAGVPRLVARLGIAREPAWIGGIGLLLLSLLAATLLLPASWWRGRRTAARGAAFATGLVGAAAAICLFFAVGLAVAVWTAGDRYVTLFGVPGAWGWLFVLPVVVIPLGVAGAAAVVTGWRRHWWSRRVRVLHAITAAAIIAFVVVTLWTGLM